MVPDCWTPACLVRQAAGDVAADAADSAADAVLNALADPIGAALASIFALLISWLLIPAVDLLGQCAPWVDSGAAQCIQSPSLQLRQWMVPITALVLLGGLVWQGVVTAVTRKGQPLLQAGKGLIAAAAWGAVGIVGTQMALRGGDQYSCWIIGQSLGADSNACDPSGIANGLLVDDAVSNLSQMLTLTGLAAGFLTLVFGLIVMLIVLVQLLLLVFREASIVILAGLLQLAAAGLVTRGTSGWLQKVLGWVLTLVAYKPIVATVYAVTFMMLGGGDRVEIPQDENDVTQLRWLVLGLAMLVLSLVALPAAAKFFNWTVGQASGGGGGGGMLAGAAMAGMYALGSHRPAGAADQARATEQALPTPSPGTPGPGTGATTPKALPPAPSGPAGTPPQPGGTGAAAAGTGMGATPAGATGAAGGPAGMAAMAVLQGAQQTAGAVKQKTTTATQTGG